MYISFYTFANFSAIISLNRFSIPKFFFSFPMESLTWSLDRISEFLDFTRLCIYLSYINSEYCISLIMSSIFDFSLFFLVKFLADACYWLSLYIHLPFLLQSIFPAKSLDLELISLLHAFAYLYHFEVTDYFYRKMFVFFIWHFTHLTLWSW